MKQLKWTSIIILFLILSLSNGQTTQASPTSTDLPEETQAVETFNVGDIPLDDLKQFWD